MFSDVWRIIWIDQNVNSNEENRQFQTRFLDEFVSFEMFESVEDFSLWIEKKATDGNETEFNFVVMSGRLAKEILEIFHLESSLISFWIFCGNKTKFDDQLRKQFSKLAEIHDDIDELLFNLHYYLRSIEIQMLIPLEILDEKTIYFDKMLRIPFDFVDRRNLLNLLYSQFELNNRMRNEIADFEHLYDENDSLEILSKQKFLHRFFLRSLINNDFDSIYLLRFYLRDVTKHLSTLNSYQKPVYRIQYLRSSQVDYFYKNTTKIIFFNQILFCHSNEKILVERLRRCRQRSNYHRVLFRIEANSNIYQNSSQQIFISNLSSFRVISIENDPNEQIFRIVLQISSEENSFKSNLSSVNSIDFCHYLRHRGHFHQSETILNRLIEQNRKEIHRIYDCLARLYQDQHEYHLSEHYYHLALNCSSSRTFRYHSMINLARIYFDLKQFDQSLEFYEKSLKISSNAVQRSISWNNLAILKFEQNRFDESFECFLKAKQIEENICLSTTNSIDRVQLGIVSTNLAVFYAKKKQNDLAEKFFEKSWNLFSEPSRETYRAMLCFCLAQFYQENRQFDRSIQFYLEAKQIWKKYSKRFLSNIQFVKQQIQFIQQNNSSSSNNI